MSHVHERAVTANASIRKRALVARALVLEPELILCDEPQVGLTQKEALRVSDALDRRRRTKSVSVLISDHDGWFEPYAVDRIWYLDEGRLRRSPTLRPPPMLPEDRVSDPMPDRPSLSMSDIFASRSAPVSSRTPPVSSRNSVIPPRDPST